MLLYIPVFTDIFYYVTRNVLFIHQFRHIYLVAFLGSIGVGISCSYTSFCHQIGSAFNGWFHTECGCVDTSTIGKGRWPNLCLLVLVLSTLSSNVTRLVGLLRKHIFDLRLRGTLVYSLMSGFRYCQHLVKSISESEWFIFSETPLRHRSTPYFAKRNFHDYVTEPQFPA